jgi:hypothetical protein
LPGSVTQVIGKAIEHVVYYSSSITSLRECAIVVVGTLARRTLSAAIQRAGYCLTSSFPKTGYAECRTAAVDGNAVVFDNA